MATAKKVKSLFVICLLAFSALLVTIPRNYTTSAQPSSGAELTGNVFDWGKDADNDTKYDYLIVAVEINVSSAGLYQVEVGYLRYMYNDSRPASKYGSTYSSGNLDAGIHTLNFSFFGPVIYADKFNINGVMHISLYGVSSDYLEYALLSRTYYYTEFDCRAVLTGVVHDGGLDTDGDGLFNKLQVGVEVNVTDRAKYEVYVSTYLYGLASTYVYNQTVGFLDPGIQTVNVLLDGAKIYGSHVGLSFLDNVYLYVYDDSYPSYTLEHKYGTPPSRSYNYTEFDPMAYFTGTFSDVAVDDDGNGLFDYLRISAGVNVTDAGRYSITLQDLVESHNSSQYIYDYENFESDLHVGLHLVNFTVYGPKIYGAHTNPVYIKGLRLQMIYKSWWWETILLDERAMIPLPTPYNYTQFESHAMLTGEIHDRGVDKDSDGLFDDLEVGVEVNVTESGTYGIFVNGLSERRGNGTQEVSYTQYRSTMLEVGMHLVNFSFPGAMIAYYRINPTDVTNLNLIQESPYCQLGSLQSVALSTRYNYTQFNPPFNNMEIGLTVYPNATVEISGSSNHTQIYPTYPRDYQPLTNATFRLSTQGDVTEGSLNGSMGIPTYPYSWRQFPYNSTSLDFTSKYGNGLLSAQLNGSAFMPPAGRTDYPFNASDFSFLGTYSNGMLNVDLSGQTTLPPFAFSIFPYNATDTTVLADYRDNKINGNITFHTISGFPLGDVIAYFSGNKTEIQVTGHINVIYGDFFGTPLNETSLEEMLSNFNSTFLGRGPQSLYNGTRGIVECTRLNTTKTPISVPSEGARVDYNATIHGNFTDLVGETLANMFFGGAPEEAQRAVNAAVDAAFSSVDYASLTLNYYHGSKIGTIDLTLSSNVWAFWDNAMQLVPPTVPLEVRSQAEAWLKIGNSTAFAIENARINASYSSARQRLDFDALLTANVSQLKSETLPILPDAVPPLLRDLVESCVNTSYCTLDSLNATAKYVNGTGEFDVRWLARGNFTAQLNHVKDCYLEYLNLTSPWMMNWQTRMLNISVVDISNLRAEIRQGTDWENIAFDGLIVHPTEDGIDRVRFKLLKWLEMTSDPWNPPRQFEKLKIAIKGGSDGTHTVLLGSLGTVPTPDTVGLDYKSMIWQNATISSLKHLLFKIAYQGVVHYVSRTFYVPIFTNSTVSDFGFDAGTKSISFNVAGDAGTGFCNVTIPRELLYALPSEWTISVNGTALTSGSFNVTENDGYVFIYLPYSHSTHVIQIQGTSIVTEFPPTTLLVVLVILSLVTAVVAVRQRRRLGRLGTRYGSTIKTFARAFQRLKK